MPRSRSFIILYSIVLATGLSACRATAPSGPSPSPLADPATAAVEPEETLLLWPDGAPGALSDEPEDRPTLAVYLPDADRATGTGIVICPGGGYSHLALGHEGQDVATWLTRNGIAAFVLTYRLGPRYAHPAMLQDVQQALRTVRARSQEWDLAPGRLGVLGFSAGGHLAASASTLYDEPVYVPSAALGGVSARPDFSILLYPVISLVEGVTHRGSRRHLLGVDADPALVDQLSLERRVDARTPPAFLVHTTADEAVPVENSLGYYAALREAGVPAALHVFQEGRHGLGLGSPALPFGMWPRLAIDWLRSNAWLGPRHP